jgi:methionyl-tRNA formyltransferase
MLRGETHTGVTLQTLHPTQFDAGVVLDQTPEPGVPIPNPATYSYADLRSMSAAMAAEMLIKAVRERSFIPPYKDVRKTRGTPTKRPSSFAPKIEPGMRYIDFQTMTSSHILRMNRAIAPLWAQARVGSDGRAVSVIFDPNMHLADMADSSAHAAMVVPSIEPGLPYTLLDEQNHIDGTSAPLLINTIDKQTLVVPMFKMPGTPYRHATGLSQRAGLLAKASQWHGKRVRAFYESLKIPTDIQEYVQSLWNATENAT